MKLVIFTICIIFSGVSFAQVDINPSYLDFGIIEIDEKSIGEKGFQPAT